LIHILSCPPSYYRRRSVFLHSQSIPPVPPVRRFEQAIPWQTENRPGYPGRCWSRQRLALCCAI